MNNEKTALITGASSGIGKAFAFKCASLGYDLILIARNEKNLALTADEVSGKYNTQCKIIPADLSVDEDVDKLVNIIKKDNSIFMLINNAGFAVPQKLIECDIEKQLDMIKVHIVAVTKLTKAALSVMLENTSGTIINVASSLAFASFPNNSIYCASKAYVNSFTKTLFYEYPYSGLVFQALNPGLTKTNFHNTDSFSHIKGKDSSDSITMMPEEVVDYSFDKLGKRLIVVPGFLNRFIIKFEGLFTKILCNKANSN